MTQPAQQQRLALAAPIYTAYQYRRALDQALLPLLKRIRALFHTQGVPVNIEQRQIMAMMMLRPMRNARTKTYQSTVRYLAGQGFTEKIPPLRPYAAEFFEHELEQNVSRLTIAAETVSDSTRTSGHFVEPARKSASGIVARHVQAPARETVQELADESGPIFGWARMLTGPSSCSFCAMLASRGAVYSSHDGAIGRGGNPLNLYHSAHLDKNGKLVGGNCDCIAVPVRKGIPWEGEDSADALDNLWQTTTERESGKSARNAFRRTWEKHVRDGSSGDFIATTMKKPPGGAT